MGSEGEPSGDARLEEKRKPTILHSVTTIPKCPGTLLMIIKEQQILLLSHGVIENPTKLN